MSVGCAILVTVEIKPDRLDDFLKAGASFFLQCAEKNEDGMCQNRGDPPPKERWVPFGVLSRNGEKGYPHKAHMPKW